MLLAIQAGQFYDQDWVGELLHRFADYYFTALAANDQKSTSVPAVWSIAFEAARDPNTQTIQNLLLGVNAHINYDLVLTLVDLLQSEWEQLGEQKRQQRYADHCQVNEIIGSTIDTVQDQVIEPLDPGLGWVDKLFGNTDEWLISKLISRWREEVWQKTIQHLENSKPGDREQLLQEIGTTTLQRSNAILLKQGLVGLRELL